MNKILVTGASGHLGGSVIKTLLKSLPSSQISIITRNVETQLKFQKNGFNAFLGSYDDVVSLEKAMKDVETVLLISSSDQGDRMQEHKNVIDSAKKVGVKHIAYTSRCLHNRKTLVNKLMVEHFETEDYIIASGLPYTFFRNILYMDAIPQFIGGNIALEKGILLPAGEGKVSFALRHEMGEAMANVLINEKPENKTYNFTGDKAYTFYDIANALSELTGKEVKYTPIETEVYEEMMAQRNLPAVVIHKILDFIADIKNNQEADVFNDLESKLHRKPMGLKDGLKELFSL